MGLFRQWRYKISSPKEIEEQEDSLLLLWLMTVAVTPVLRLGFVLADEEMGVLASGACA